ncbi:MAG: DUF4405 domain-containing protein [Bacteroidales bacterium]|nr:DUF4405 domain-containing protein [Bacteroidales bacterium]MBN2633317.1 DUF4405 domain-containing protein [Bacteroidales bacterium]
MKTRKKFSLRSFTSFSLVISTLIMSWSGFILYIAPPGRIANWGSWKLMLFTKTEWQALHTIFSYLFFILVVIHLFFINWRTFLVYFKSKLKAGLNRKWELVSAVILSALVFAGTLRSWTPFGPVMTFGEKVQEGWGNKFETPPVIHMENYTLEQLSPLFDSIPAEELARKLAERSIRIKESDTTLKLIGEENHITPSEIYDMLVEEYGEKDNESNSGVRQGNYHGQGGAAQGYGRYTLKMAADNLGLEVSDLVQKLKEKGIDAGPETTMRNIADRLGVTPREAYTMLTEK